MGIVGNGGDDDAATFTFDPQGKSLQLRTGNGDPITPAQVKSLYGKEFTILADGVDICSVEYTWKKGFGCDQPLLKPIYMDLSKWETAKVEPGFVAIDHVLGRFKFSTGNALPERQLVKFIKRVQLGNYSACSPVLRGNYVYTTHNEETRGLQAVNIGDPCNLRYAGYVPMVGYNSSIALGKDYAYVKCRQTMGIADIRDPENIKFVKGVPAYFEGATVYINGNSLYITGSKVGICAYDLSDPDDPLPIDLIELIGINSIVPHGEYIYAMVVDDKKNGSIVVLKQGENDVMKEVGRLNLGECENLRPMRYGDGYLFFGDKNGLHIVDVSKSSEPKVIATYDKLKARSEGGVGAEGGGRGLADYIRDGDYLYVTASHSEPHAGHFAEFPPMANLKDEDIPKQDYVGGVYVLDIKNPAEPKLAGHIDDIRIGLGNPSQIAGVKDGVLYMLCPPMGLVSLDVSDLKNMKRLGKISLYGEVENARIIGDKIYATGNGLYVIDPYPAEEARLLGFCWSPWWLFGYHFAAKPDSKYGIFYKYGQGSANRLIDISNPEKPEIAEHYFLSTEWSIWVGNYLYAAKPPKLSMPINYDEISTWKIPVKDVVEKEKQAIKKGFVIYDMSNPRDPMLIFQYETEEDICRVLLRGNYAYAYSDGAPPSKDKPGVSACVYIFDVSIPKESKLLGKWTGYYDQGAMASPHPYIKDNYMYLPSDIIYHQDVTYEPPKGPRVLDITDPANPKLHTIMSFWDDNIGVNSMMGANSFHIRGDRLYIADYWDGLHVLDISGGPENAKMLGTIKDKDHPWSCFSYCTSIDGHGKYIYTTNFGAVDIYEIPVPSEIPEGKLTANCQPKT